ncbi:glutathione S-transferase family protein [Pseudidiomarina gelatinasegens]|jgi:glutathione S-transferase|uniref:Glutathione S-transferase family protein n=1 Tax=Pseudidiomarina gelatinasegens TaxID=2487740 RepID=A0A443YYE8_9GAMM|nr:glutathione S-transferase family protein [Pseudidiomarina gelatinasegens]RWU09132.1 glutathione S-transferase family protein [Pseudidiomarina gelatinasegens]
MKIYQTATAPNPRRVRMFLAEKGLLDNVEFIEVDIAKGENLTPEFVAMNPMKKVPVAVLDDGTSLAETMAICRYVEEAHPDTPKLLGESPKQKALIEQWLRWVDFYLMVPVGMCFQHTSGYFKDRMNCFPDYGQDCFSAAEKFLAFLNEHLKDKTYIMGDSFSAADINAFATVGFARVVKLRIGADQVHLQAWFDRINQRASAKV